MASPDIYIGYTDDKEDELVRCLISLRFHSYSDTDQLLIQMDFMDIEEGWDEYDSS